MSTAHPTATVRHRPACPDRPPGPREQGPPGRDARDRLVRANLPLVVRIARRFRGRGTDEDDLIADGNLGLLHAAVKFDPSFEAPFSTYAAFWIRKAILHAWESNGRLVRIPGNMARLIRTWHRAELEMSVEAGWVPSFEDIAGRLDLSSKQREMGREAFRAWHFRGPGDPCEKQGGGIEAMHAEVEEPGAAMEREEEARGLREQMILWLTPRERLVLGLRFGLEDGESRTLREIGGRLGVARESVWKIEVRALAKLRAAGGPVPGGGDRQGRKSD